MQGGGAGWACTHCREPLGGSAFRALGRGYHLRCFACAACKTPLPDGRFFASKPIPPATDQIPLCGTAYLKPAGKREKKKTNQRTKAKDWWGGG